MDRADFTHDFATCEHIDRDYEAAERSAGQYGDYWLCNDCGAHADTAVWVAGARSRHLVPVWQAPVFDA